MITALYYNDLAEDNNPQLFEEIQSMVSEIKIDTRASSGLGGEELVIEALRYTLERMLANKEGHYDRQDLITTLSINLQGNNEYILIAKNALEENVTSIDARKRVTSIMQELRYEKKKNKLRQVVTKMNAKVNFSGEFFELSPLVNTIMMELQEIQFNKSSEEITGFVGRVNFTDEESIEEALTKGVELNSAEGLWNTGLRGLNAAAGGGPSRGALVNFGALTHNYKSGILNDLFLNLPVFNQPWMWDSTKKPLILNISFEQTIDQNIILLYEKFYEVKYNKPCNIKDINYGDAKKELKEYLEQNGYTVLMEHYEPSNFCIYDLFDILNRYIDEGYEIHAVICDYLSQIAKNTAGDKDEMKIQKTFEMTRNFCYPRGITFFTGHQLSTEAQQLSRENTTTFTRKVCTGGWYMHCKALHTKLDLEFVMHIHEHQDGNKYLMFSKGKHRIGGSKVPLKYNHFIYKFEQVGGIVPDVLEENSRVLYELPRSISMDDVVESWD